MDSNCLITSEKFVQILLSNIDDVNNSLLYIYPLHDDEPLLHVKVTTETIHLVKNMLSAYESIFMLNHEVESNIDDVAENFLIYENIPYDEGLWINLEKHNHQKRGTFLFFKDADTLLRLRLAHGF